ncbi:hypothetical protein niasHT_005306 [Heterodera trifolii]|uniref:C3H1-type domain-containing protein n=1 Tax=Heterodera trifolii TaxID=157864 RepID=A0ABD2M0W8_9BILA
MDGNGSQNSAENNWPFAHVDNAELDDGTSSKANSTEFFEETTEEGGEKEGEDNSSDGPNEEPQSEDGSGNEDEADEGQFCSPSPPPIDGTADGEVPNYSEDEQSTESASECNDVQNFDGIEDNVIDLDNNELNYDEEGEEDEEENGDERDSASKSDKRRDSLDCGGAEQVSDSDEDQKQHRTAEELQGQAISSEGEEDEEEAEGNPKDGDKERVTRAETKQDDVEEEDGELSEQATREGENRGQGEEDEDLEEGELRSDEDSDDGIPEIRGGLSPPGLPLLIPPSVTSHLQQPSLLFLNPPPNPLLLPPPVPSFDPSKNQNRELCRYFMKGFCVNGEACRFKHSRTDAGVHFPPSESMRKFPTTFLLGRHVIPPPTGPPIPLLSTEFVPPPSLLAGVTANAVTSVHSLVNTIRPAANSVSSVSARPNAESAAWERGLRQARAMVRRQQKKSESDDKTSTEREGEEMEGEKGEEKGQNDDNLMELKEGTEQPNMTSGWDGTGEQHMHSGSPTLAKVSSDEGNSSDDDESGAFGKGNGEGKETERNGRIFVPPSVLAPPLGFSRRPVISRVVVEASYSVGVSRHRSSSSPPPPFSEHQLKLQGRGIKAQKPSFGIPSLIDAIRVKPIPPPPPPTNSNTKPFISKDRKTATARDEVDQQRDHRGVLTTSNMGSSSAIAYSDPWARNASPPRRHGQRGRTTHRTHSPHSSASSADEFRSRHRNTNALSAGESLSRRHRSRSSSPRNKRRTTTVVERKGQWENAAKRRREQRTPPASSFDDQFAVDSNSRHRPRSPPNSSPSRRKSPSADRRYHHHRHNRRSSPSSYHSLGALLTTSSSTAEWSRQHKGPRTPPEPPQNRKRWGNSSRSASPLTPSGRSSVSRATSSDRDEEAKGGRRRTKKREYISGSVDNGTAGAAAVQHRFGDGISVSSMPRALINRQPPVISASTKKAGGKRMSASSSAFVPEDEEDEAPAAYRLPSNATGDARGQKRKRSVSSSSSSSSVSSSDSSSSSGSSSSSSASSHTPLKNAKPKALEHPSKRTTNEGEKSNDISGSGGTTISCSTVDQSALNVTKAEQEEVNAQNAAQMDDESGHKQLSKNIATGERKNVKTEKAPCNTSHLADGDKKTSKTKDEGKDEPTDEKSGAAPSSVDHSKKRREQLLRQLQSVEEAIARKRQRGEGAS